MATYFFRICKQIVKGVEVEADSKDEALDIFEQAYYFDKTIDMSDGADYLDSTETIERDYWYSDSKRGRFYDTREEYTDNIGEEPYEEGQRI